MSNIEIAPIKIEEIDIAIDFVEKLLNEIMTKIDAKAFNFDVINAKNILKNAILTNKTTIFIAKAKNLPIGIIALYEGFALYANGSFGIISELFVLPEYRKQNVGQKLIDCAKDYAKAKKWGRLEVATPPIPAFERSLAFYQKEGFELSGGRKLKFELQ